MVNGEQMRCEMMTYGDDDYHHHHHRCVYCVVVADVAVVECVVETRG